MIIGPNTFTGINPWAVLVASVATMVIGFLWYSPILFARPWMRLMGCDPEDTSGLHSQGLAALSNVSGHELSEARTDPTGLGWFDASGEENGDKCAWTFNVPLVTFSNRSKWKIQGEWSNAAYNAGTGYSNSSGQKGCLDGR